jgi:hypothetical protein
VKPNDFGAIFGIKKVALNGIFDHVAQLIERIGLGGNAITKRLQCSLRQSSPQ